MPNIDITNSILGRLGEAAIGASGSYESTKLGTEAQRAIADLQNRLGYYQTRTQNKQAKYQTDVGAATSRYQTDAESSTARDLSQNTLRGVLYGADAGERTSRYSADVGAQTSRYQANTERDIAGGRLGYDYAKLKYGQGVFDRLYGLVSPYLSGGAAGGTGDVGIDVRGVYSPNQVNQQVASGRAQVAGQTALLDRQIRQGAAGRGLAAGSPLIQLLTANNSARSIGQGVDLERDLRLGAAEKNAANVLAGQQARAQAVTGRFSALAQILGAGLGAL